MVQKMKSQKKPVKNTFLLLMIVGGILLIPIIVLFLSCAKMFFHIDLSQDYRKIDGVENIIFCRQEQSYKRCFWGLKSIDGQLELPEQDQRAQKALAEELKQLIDCKNTIDAAVFSPDGRYILYCEIDYNHYKTDMTDDEYCYYRIYDTDTKKIVTVYKGYREWFDLSWK